MNNISFEKEFEKALLQYDRATASQILKLYIDENNNDFIDNVIVKALISIGEKWEKGDIALSQVYMSGKMCEELSETILPGETCAYKSSPNIAIVTLEDHHTLGRKIVKSVFKAAGYKLTDYGYGITAEQVLERIIKDGVRIMLISVLMYPAAIKVKSITDEISKRNLRVKVLVGGAPFILDEELWRKVGADGFATNAAEGLKIAEQWCKEIVEEINI